MIEKAWGWTEPLVATPLFEMHRLLIKPQHRCSMHVHQHKLNTFYVLGGVLILDVYKEGPSVDVYDHFFLGVGQWRTIEPHTYHQFRTAEGPCRALEMCYIAPLSEDIIRSNVGGAA